MARWRELSDRLLAQDSPRTSDVMDTFGSLVKLTAGHLFRYQARTRHYPRGAPSWSVRPLCSMPNSSASRLPRTYASCAPPIRRRRHSKLLLRVSDAVATESSVVKLSEADRFTVVDGDPSQDRAVLRSRSVPGLLIEGPPGTGKSQTIVNTVADSIGRSETVLVVCQKQAALRVVQNGSRPRAWATGW